LASVFEPHNHRGGTHVSSVMAMAGRKINLKKQIPIMTNTHDQISEVYTVYVTVPLQKAKKGTVDKFKGILSKKFPELNNISDEELGEVVRR